MTLVSTKITATTYLNVSKLHRYFFNVWIYQLEHLDLCSVSQGLTFKLFLLWVRASTGVGFWDPKRTREPTTRKKSNFYSDGFWLSKYVCIKKCNLILCFYMFVYTWGCIKSKRGVPETLKIKPWFKGFGPPFVFETCRTSIHFLVSRTNKEKKQRITLLKHSWNSNSKMPKKHSNPRQGVM